MWNYRSQDRLSCLVKNLIVAPIVFFFIGDLSADASLLGSEVSMIIAYQETPVSSPHIVYFPKTERVIEPGTEFFKIADMEVVNSPSSRSPVNVSVDVGGDYIEIDFDDTTSSTRFSSGFQNAYVFTFDNSPEIIGAFIDTRVTSLGIEPSDVTFYGSQLFVNVEGLLFDTSSFVRINLLTKPFL